MGILNFEKLPVSTLVGADRQSFDSVMKGVEVEKGYRSKVRLTHFVQRLLSPLYCKNNRCYQELAPHKGEQEPIFIIGHWRSGTTFMHDVFCCDERFGYCTTYQTVFPHVMLWGASFFKRLVAWFMPSTRATDKMELGVEIPQEEEIALSNMTAVSHYHFLSFPRRMAEFRERCLVFKSATAAEVEEFGEALRKLIRISLHVQKRDIFLSKNPPHTGRVAELLKLYPNAKFVYLVRNPYTVFESTRNFFGKTAASTGLQSMPEDFEEQILLNYKALYEKYESDKSLIPEGNLVEVRFEDFEVDPVAKTEEIYRLLRLGDFEHVRPKMEAYVGSKKGFKKNCYNYDAHTIEVVEKYCSPAIEQWGYEKLSERK